jgi:hypothetical protein
MNSSKSVMLVLSVRKLSKVDARSQRATVQLVRLPSHVSRRARMRSAGRIGTFSRIRNEKASLSCWQESN